MLTNMNLTSVVLLVGGTGSRFSSLNQPPKQLSKLNKNEILIHIIKNIKRYGLNHFILPLGYKKNFFVKFLKSKKNVKRYGLNILRNKFNIEDLKNNKINISFFDAGRKTNKLTRVSKSLRYIIGKDLLVVYGDDLANINLNKLFHRFNMFKKKKAIITVCKKKSQYGHVLLDKKKNVKKFIEKPKLADPINMGYYLMDSSLIKKFKRKSFELENDFIPILIKKKLLQSYEHKGYFYSINDKKELINAEKRLKKN